MSGPLLHRDPGALLVPGNVLGLESYIEDAKPTGDDELADFFARGQAQSRKDAEQGKEQLRKRLAA